jgi:hypothetical protein
LPKLVISDLSAGRNGIDSPVSAEFPFDQCVSAINVDFRNGGLGRRRGGLYDVIANTTNDPGSDQRAFIRHVPSGDETQGEVWSANSLFEVKRLPAGTAWLTPNQFDGNLNAATVTGVSFNGKLFLFASGGFSTRVKVYDSTIDQIRVAGIRTPGVPTVANQGAGAYAAVQRWYRVRFSTTARARFSEPSTSVAFTPSGAGASARITRPALHGAPLEYETVWEVEASGDNVNFYVIAQLVVGTTFFDDTNLVAGYPTFELSKVIGTFTLPPSAKFGVTDGNRLIMGGDWTGTTGSRIWWTPVLGSLDISDDERMFQTATIKPYLDLDQKNGGNLTGIGQINGVIYAFKSRQVWRLSPTEDLAKPYSARRLSGLVGAVTHQSIALGEDTFGAPCLYFMSYKGPYRVGPNGLEYLGRDIEDATRTAAGAPNINTNATTMIAHSVFHADLSQWWLWMSTGTNNSPDRLFVLDIHKATRRDEYGVRGGWSEFTGLLATALCSAMANATLGATASLRPWAGFEAAAGAARIVIADRDDLQTDIGTTFIGTVTTRSLGNTKDFGTQMSIGESLLVARHRSSDAGGVTLYMRVLKDFGTEITAAFILIPLADSNKTVIRKFDASTIADAATIQLKLGDPDTGPSTGAAWQLDLLEVPITLGGDV